MGYSKHGWLLATKSRCSRNYSTRSSSISKWNTSSYWLCTFTKTQVRSLFRCRNQNFLSIHYILHDLLDVLDRGNATCQGRPGSLGYETKDANTYAIWGVDYLKLDSCNTNGTPAVVEYSIMRDALNATGRPIFFSLCGMHIDHCFYSIYLRYVSHERWGS